MNTHSEHRKGVGRPRTYSERGRRVDVYLPEHQIQWLKKENNMSKTIQKAINNTMEQQARDRINEMGFTAEQKNFIFADWSNRDEHIAWLLIATRDEITSWGEAGEWGIDQDNVQDEY